MSFLCTEIDDSRCSMYACKQKTKSNAMLLKKVKKLKQRNRKLKQKVKFYETAWMPKQVFVFANRNLLFYLTRPTGVAASYFIDTYKRISKSSHKQNSNEKTERTDGQEKNSLKVICDAFNIDEKVLNRCKRRTITKTCREITKRLYSDVSERAKMRVSLIPQENLFAIHGKYLGYYF